MAPSATDTVVPIVEDIKQKVIPGIQKEAVQEKQNVDSSAVSATELEDDELPKLETGHKEPLKLSGALDQFKQFDVTPVIGREFVDVDLAEWLRAPNSDELIRDLAITGIAPIQSPNYPSPAKKNLCGLMPSPVSQRGVVFFRKQDNINNDLQKELVQRLGELSGKPATSKLHIHPVINSGREDGDKDDEISTISSKQAKRLYSKSIVWSEKKQTQRNQWHSDITFEPIPSDYALLRLTQLPKTGGGK